MNLRPSQLIVLGASALVIVFSFFNFYKFDDFGSASASDVKNSAECSADHIKNLDGAEARVTKMVCRWAKDGGVNAWSTDLFFPLTTWPAIIAALVFAASAAVAFANVRLPDSILGFSAAQFLFGLSVASALILFAFLVEGTDQGFGLTTGFWLMAVGTVGIVVGTFMEVQAESGAGSYGGPAMPPSPF